MFGIQSYLFKGIRVSKSKIKPGLFQSMTLLDLVVYHREKHSLQSVKEVRIAHPFKTIPFDIRKSSVVLFINELAYKAIREEEPNPDLFEFLWQTCLDLDGTEESVSGFHIRFALELMHHLGIFPQNNYSSAFPVFNLREGLFQASIPVHPNYLDQEYSRMMSGVLEKCQVEANQNGEIVKWRNGEMFQDAGARNKLLEIILLYYQLHLPGFREVQSHHILHEVLA